MGIFAEPAEGIEVLASKPLPPLTVKSVQHAKRDFSERSCLLTGEKNSLALFFTSEKKGEVMKTLTRRIATLVAATLGALVMVAPTAG
jgi:hypothetical protein